MEDTNKKQPRKRVATETAAGGGNKYGGRKERGEYKPRTGGRSYGGRKSFDEKSERSDRKPYSGRGNRSDQESHDSERPARGRREGGSERTERGSRGGGKEFGGRPERRSCGECKPRTDKPYGERKERREYREPKEGKEGRERRERREGGKEYKPRTGGRSYDSERPARGRREGRSERTERGSRGGGKEFGGRPERRSYGERKPRTDKPYGERREYRDRKEPREYKEYREPKERRESGEYKPRTGGKSYGGRKSFSEKSERTGRGSRSSVSKEPGDRPQPQPQADKLVRLNKYIANAGVCSRREADELIVSGAVKVNGEVCTVLGTKVGPNDIVNFGGEVLKDEKKVYLLMNKPKGFITTVDDPNERKTVMELIKDACKERIYPVGRLDRNTTGVLLFTNDGELAKRLTHPSHGARKVYHVTLDRSLTKVDMAKIANGIELEDGAIQVDQIQYVEAGDKTEVGIQIHSGRNRIIRRIFEQLEYKVTKLDRVIFAELTKKNLSRGQWRMLSELEVNFLKQNA